jgi:hypothetical protein
MAAGGLDVGGIQDLEATDGPRVFSDVNANSNLNGASRIAAFQAAHLTSITAWCRKQLWRPQGGLR